MKNTLIALAAVSCAIVSCALESDFSAPSSEKNAEVVLTASLDATKIALQNDYSVLWEDGDKIAIYGTAAHTFSIVSGGAATAQFTGDLGEDVSAAALYATYPESSFVSASGNVVTVNIPNYQKPVKDGFDKKSVVSVSKVTEGAMVMKHAVALVRFQISSSDITSVSINNAAGINIAGNIAVTIPDSGQISCGAATAGNVLLVPQGAVFEPGVYYAAVAPASLTGGIQFSFTRSTDDKIATKVGANPVSFAKGSIMNFGTIDSSLSWEAMTKISLDFAKTDSNGDYVLTDGKISYESPFSDPASFATSFKSGSFKGAAATFTASAGNMPLDVFSTMGWAQHSTMGLRWGRGAGSYINVPKVEGLTLRAVKVMFGGPTLGSSKQGYLGLASCGSAVNGGDFFNAVIDYISPAVWHIVSPDASATYRLETFLDEDSQEGECDLAGIEFLYSGTPASSVNGLECSCLVVGLNAAMSGSFWTMDSEMDYTCGFEYKLSSAAEWTNVAAEKAMKFSADAVFEIENDYLVRSWVDAGSGKVYSEPFAASTKSVIKTFDFTTLGSQFTYSGTPITETISEGTPFSTDIILDGKYHLSLTYTRSGTRSYNDEFGVKWIDGYLHFAASKNSYFLTPAISGLTLNKVVFTFEANTTGSATIAIYSSTDDTVLSNTGKAVSGEVTELTLIPTSSLAEATSYKLILSKGETKKDRQAVKSIVLYYSGTEK